jgi:hypothetical protein
MVIGSRSRKTREYPKISMKLIQKKVEQINGRWVRLVLMPCDPSAHGKPDPLSQVSIASPSAFSVAFGNPQNLGYFILGMDLRIQAAINQRESEPEYPSEPTEQLITTVGNQSIEPRLAKVEELLHIHVETLAPSQFLEAVRTFLEAVGITNLVEISVNEEQVQAHNSAKPGLQETFAQCRQILEKDGPKVQTIEISSNGKNEEFSILLDFHYRRKHRHEQAPVELEVRALSSEFGPRDDESFSDYRARMNALDMDLGKRAKVIDAILAEKKSLYSDYAHHLAEAFPGVRINLYEARIPTNE